MKLLAVLPLLVAASTTTAFSCSRRSLLTLGSRSARTNQLLQVATSTRSSSPRASLSMHMGHSHSHHNHHDHKNGEEKKPKLTPQQMAQRRRRRVAMFLFAALAIFGPPTLIKKRALTNADGAAFFVSTILLASADKIRQEIRVMLTKLSSFKEGIAKHSSPDMSMNPMSYLGSKSDDNNIAWNGQSNSASRAADRVTVLGVVINLVLSVGKFMVGVSCHSSALIADAGHSLSDLFSDFVTLYSVQLARLPPDDDHPYGHGKFEAIGSLFLALTLIGTGISVGAMANKELLKIWAASRAAAATQTASTILLPRPPALLMAAISIVSKEWLYRVTKKVGDDLNSQVVIANAWHHRSDAYSSVLALFSIAVAISVPGMVAADAMAGILVAGMIGITGIDILSESIQQLSDTTSAEWIQKVETIVQEEVMMGADEDVISVTRIRARPAGSLFLVDVRITTPSTLSTSGTRAVEERVRRHLLRRLQGQVIDAEVHATPVSSLTTMAPPASTTKLGGGGGGETRSLTNSSNSNSISKDNGQPLPIKNVDGSVVCPLLVQQQDQRIPHPTMTDQDHNHDHDHNHSHDQNTEQSKPQQPMSSVLYMPPSASEMQREVRQIALLLQHNFHDPTQEKLEDQSRTVQPYVVEGVTVHYEDTMTIVVDVDLSIIQPQKEDRFSKTKDTTPRSIPPTLTMAQGYSDQLKKAVEEYYYSNLATVNYNVQAKVFLDLTTSSSTATRERKNNNADGNSQETVDGTEDAETTPTIISTMATTAAIPSTNTTATTTAVM